MRALRPRSCPAVPRAGGGTLVATQGAGRAVGSPGSRCAGFCVKDSIIYIALIRLSRWLFCWVMLQAVCKSRHLDHTRELTARLRRGEAALCRAVLWAEVGSTPACPLPGARGVGKEAAAAPGRREGRDAERPAHPAAASPGHPSPPGVYSMLLVTRSRRAGSSCLAPLPPFVSFCSLRPETEHLMEKACSPALCGDTRFLPPRPGTAPAAVPAAAPLASGWPCAATGGQGGAGARPWRGQTLVPAGPVWVLCTGQSRGLLQTGICRDHRGTTWAQVPSACPA